MRVGLIGCGLWGSYILRDLLSLGGQVTVVEPDARHRQRALAAGAGAVADTLEDLPPVDGIIVATPATTHAAIVEEALRWGVPLFVEKPFTTDVAEAERLVALAGGRIFVMDVWRYHPGVETIARIVDSQELGAVQWIRSTRNNWTSPRTDVDCIWTLAPHDLSISLELLGRIPTPRGAIAERVDGQPTGLVCLLGDRPGMVVEVSTRYADKRRELRVHFSEGVAVLTGAAPAFVEIAHGRPTSREPSRIERRPISDEPALTRELRVFLDYLRGGPPPRSSAADGLAVVRILTELREMAGI